MKELNNIIEDVEKALWELQDYFNHQPKEDMPGYLGTCPNEGSFEVYRLRIEFGRMFPNDIMSFRHIANFEMVDFLKEYYTHSTPLRLGQAFCNKFKIRNNELFYQPDQSKCIEIINKEKYVDYDSDDDLIIS